MPKGVYTRTKPAGFKKGHTPWNTGLVSEKKGKKRPEFSGRNHPNFGRKYKLSEDAILKIKKSKTGKNNPMYGKPSVMGMLGKKHSENTKKQIQEKQMELVRAGTHHRWKGGITPENNKIRTSIEMRLWRNAVFARDNYTCQKTGKRGSNLVAHHILNFAEHKDLRFAIDNGVTLSKDAHTQFHKIYSKKNNTREQLQEFIKTRV